MAYEPFNPITIGSPIREEWGSKVQNNLQDHENRLLNIGGAFDYEKVIYIAPNSGGGSDVNGTGTEGNPYETLQKAIDSIQASTVTSNGSFVIQAANGTYTFYKPVKINQFSRIAIRGNLSDHSLVVFDFDLRSYSIPTPLNGMEKSACFQAMMSSVEYDGFTTTLTYDAPVATTMENFNAYRSNIVIGNVEVNNPVKAGFHIIGSSCISVMPDKTLSGTVYQGILCTLSSSLGIGDNGAINLTAAINGEGKGVSTDVSSEYIPTVFQSVTLSGFEEDVNTPSTSQDDIIHYGTIWTGSTYVFASYPIPADVKYIEIEASIFGTLDWEADFSSKGIWVIRRSDMHMRGGTVGHYQGITSDLNNFAAVGSEVKIAYDRVSYLECGIIGNTLTFTHCPNGQSASSILKLRLMR